MPRTGMLEAKAKDQGHKRKCSPKKKVSTKIFQAISKEKKKVFTKIFQAISTKKSFPKNFSSAPQNFDDSKLVLPRAEDRPIFEDFRPRGRGQGQGLDFRGQIQGLQNVSSRPRMSSRTPPLKSTHKHFWLDFIVNFHQPKFGNFMVKIFAQNQIL